MAMIIILCLIWAIIIEKKIFQSSNPLYPRDLHELSKPHNEVSNFKKKKNCGRRGTHAAEFSFGLSNIKARADLVWDAYFYLCSTTLDILHTAATF